MDTPVEWLRRSEVKSIRIDERFILIRTLEPVRRDKHGRADRLWFRLDTLSLKMPLSSKNSYQHLPSGKQPKKRCYKLFTFYALPRSLRLCHQ